MPVCIITEVNRMNVLSIQLGLGVVVLTHVYMLNIPGSRPHALINLGAAAAIAYGLF